MAHKSWTIMVDLTAKLVRDYAHRHVTTSKTLRPSVAHVHCEKIRQQADLLFAYGTVNRRVRFLEK